MQILLLCLLYSTHQISGNPPGILSGIPHSSLSPSHHTRVGWFPFDCQDIWDAGYRSDGEYIIYLQGSQNPLPVHCDMTTNGTAWTVFQKRFDGSVDFNRDWQDYSKGFGNANGEYWLGLQNIYRLTMQRAYELRVELEDFEGHGVYASYLNFSLSPHALNAEGDGYKLYVDGFSDGGAGDSLSAHSGHMFSTYNNDQEENLQNCAEYWAGGFWYHSEGCADAALNARYVLPDAPLTSQLGFSWITWVDYPQFLRGSQMKMRRLQSMN
ncbi:microfibril-associated glycoprotein 4-like [Pelodytes ibericus]